MNLTELLALDPRERDHRLAEKIMPWQGGNPIPGYDGRWPWPPPFSTDAAADYVVLEHVRTWVYSRRAAFARALDEVLQSRSGLECGVRLAYPDAMMRYRVGDYSLAALLSLG